MKCDEQNGQSVRQLGFWMCSALVVGNMIGAGVFLMPATLAIYGGISLAGWLFSAVGAMLLAIVFSRLSRRFPNTGGPYVYTRVCFGDFAGFIVAWGYWISALTGNAAISVAFIGYLGSFFPALAGRPILAALSAIATVWLLTGVNVSGLRTAGGVQVVTVCIKLIPLLGLATLGFGSFHPEHFIPLNLSGRSDFSAIAATAALTMWAFLGLESATIPADDVRSPERTIPRATLFGTIVAAIVYIAGTAAVMGILSPNVLAKSTAPFADASQAIWGTWAGRFIGIGAAVSCLGALNGWILVQGQIPFATARDGLFPRVFQRISKKGTPIFGLVLSSVFITFLIVLNYTKSLVELFTFVVLLSTITSLLPYAFSALSDLILIFRGQGEASRWCIVRHSTVAVTAFLFSIWAIGGSGKEAMFWGAMLLVSGIPLYGILVRSRSRAAASV